MTEQIVKLSNDEIEIKQVVENTEKVNVEEIKSQMEALVVQKTQTIADFDAKIASLQTILDKAALAGVTPDGVVGDGNVVSETVPEETVADAPADPL